MINQPVTIVPVTQQAAIDYIEALDLDYIVQDMCADTYPLPRWTLADAKHGERLYKNFLILLKEHLPESLAPTREIDEFWHNHILYTKNYHRDCLHIFGHYLHHQPKTPNDDPKDLVNAYLKTKTYYLARFKQPLDLIINEK